MISGQFTGSSRSAEFCQLPHLAPDRRMRSIRRKGTYYAGLAVRADPAKASSRCQRDTELEPKIRQVWDDNWKVYGVRKTWRQLRREGVAVACCTVARLMAGMGLTVNASIHLTANRLRGAIRGRGIKTTFSDTSIPCPRDKVNRQFRASAPNILCPYGDVSIAYRVTGQRLYLRINVARIYLCCFHHRHFCQPHCWLESITVCKD
jgi:transposase InsO family protein